MRRIVLLMAAMALAQPAWAAEKKAAVPSRKQKPAEPAKRAVTPEMKEAVVGARYMFLRRVDLCTAPYKCDRETLTVVDAAEERFVAACRACAPEKTCEDDRATIRSGKASRSYNPCE